MEHLTLVALSEDHSRLLLVDRHGVQYTLDVDHSLRSAVRGVQPRPGHLETRMDSALRPRDIQARIRAGETAEAVAAAAGSTVEKIMPFAAPVLAERAHVAQRAQKSSVRRRSADSNQGARTLEEAVQSRLRARNTDPDTVEWDSYRREDGRWTLTGLYETSERTGVATFIFDLPGNYVTLEDDDARWLVGDLVTEAPRGLGEPDPRRLSSVPSALGDDAIQLVKSEPEVVGAAAAPVAPASVTEPAPSAPEAVAARPAATEPAVTEPAAGPAPVPLGEERTVDLTETVNNIRSAISRPEAASPAREQAPAAPSVEPRVEPTPGPADEPATQAPAEATTETETAQEKKSAAKKSAKRRGRASVPSWDEIMFGGGNSE